MDDNFVESHDSFSSFVLAFQYLAYASTADTIRCPRHKDTRRPSHSVFLSVVAKFVNITRSRVKKS